MKKQKDKPKSKKRFIRIGIFLILAFVVCWYLFVRITSPWNVIRIRSAINIEHSSTQVNPESLRIGTYNIAHGRGNTSENFNGETAERKRERISEIAQLIKNQDLDIVILNEVDFNSFWSGGVNQAEIIAREAGYPYFVEQRNADGAISFLSLRFGNVVLSRFPVVDAKHIPYPAFAWWESLILGCKQGVICTVELPDESHLRVVPVHLEHRWAADDIRIESAEMIRAELEAADTPVILAGDFNTSPPGFKGVRANRIDRTALSVFLNDNTGLKTLPHDDTNPINKTFPATEPRRTIDWIIVPNEWQILSREVIQTTLSDHLPVVMEVIP